MNKSDTVDYWLAIIKYKKYIFIFTFLATFFMSIYQYYNNPAPKYTSSLMIEIGEKYFKGFNNWNYDQVKKILLLNETFYFTTPGTLKLILEKKYPQIKVKIPYGSYNIIEISTSNTDKSKTKSDLLKTYNYILQKHQIQSKLYDKYVMTKHVGSLNIKEETRNKPKKLLMIIVTSISSFIFSIYAVILVHYYLVVIKPKLFKRK